MTTPENRQERLMALKEALVGHGLIADLAPAYIRVHEYDRPSGEITVRCAPRASDGNRLWYLCGDRPLSEADDITTALVAVKGLLAR